VYGTQGELSNLDTALLISKGLIMKREGNCVANAVLLAVVLNLVLPLVLTPLATPEEIQPPTGASDLSLKGQFMHMMVHHGQVPLMSSVIVALVAGLAVFLGYRLNPMGHIQKVW
jgi:hypothetical protein